MFVGLVKVRTRLILVGLAKVNVGSCKQACADTVGRADYEGEPAEHLDRAIYDFLAGIPSDDPETDARMGELETIDDIAIGFLGSLNNCDSVVDFLLEQLGSVRRSYRRETRHSLQRVISDI